MLIPTLSGQDDENEDISGSILIQFYWDSKTRIIYIPPVASQRATRATARMINNKAKVIKSSSDPESVLAAAELVVVGLVAGVAVADFLVDDLFTAAVFLAGDFLALVFLALGIGTFYFFTSHKHTDQMMSSSR